MYDPGDKNLAMIATTMAGLEEALSAELKLLGAREVQVLRRAVKFRGDRGFLYKANLCLRTGLRVLLPVVNTSVLNTEDLYRKVLELEWESLISPRDTISVDVTLNSPRFGHSLYTAQKVKDAIADRMRQSAGSRPSVDKADPDLRINVHITGTDCTLSLDSSGESLHKRGYRKETNIAPLNEVLAAGMIALSGWDRRSPFIDPMCGSGTLPIEAALMAASIPPGYFRLNGIEKQKYPFGFMRWKAFDKELWEKIQESVLNRINNSTPAIIASDVSSNVTRKARINIRSAKVDDMIQLRTEAFGDLRPPADHGIIIMNPPYGERMDKDDLEALYREMGNTLKKNWQGHTCWILTSGEKAIHSIGLHASRRITLYNGPLECRFMKFDLYEGSRKSNRS